MSHTAIYYTPPIYHTHAHTHAHMHTHAEEEKKRAEETVVGGKGLITKIKFFPLCFHITTSF